MLAVFVLERVYAVTVQLVTTVDGKFALVVSLVLEECADGFRLLLLLWRSPMER
jgi:hypothetical protein